VTALAVTALTSGAALLVCVPVGLALAWKFAGTRPGVLHTLVETAVVLPLVLPPTVVGYVLLTLLGRGSATGRFLQDVLGLHLLFTWQGAALAAALVALPLLVRTAAAAFGSVDRDFLDVGRTLGASEATLFWGVTLPLAYRGVIAGITLAAARAVGEFGATLVVAGAIPGRTQTLSIALYDALQSGDRHAANGHALTITGVTLGLLAVAHAATLSLARSQAERW
jgi:molybdate transport system permease protein